MNIKYKHKETGLTISLEEIKRLRNERHTIHLHENRHFKDDEWVSVESIKSFEYDYESIILGDDFEPICEETEFTINELEILLHCVADSYICANEMELRHKIRNMLIKKRENERL